MDYKVKCYENHQHDKLYLVVLKEDKCVALLEQIERVSHFPMIGLMKSAANGRWADWNLPDLCYLFPKRGGQDLYELMSTDTGFASLIAESHDNEILIYEENMGIAGRAWARNADENRLPPSFDRNVKESFDVEVFETAYNKEGGIEPRLYLAHLEKNTSRCARIGAISSKPALGGMVAQLQTAAESQHDSLIVSMSGAGAQMLYERLAQNELGARLIASNRNCIEVYPENMGSSGREWARVVEFPDNRHFLVLAVSKRPEADGALAEAFDRTICSVIDPYETATVIQGEGQETANLVAKTADHFSAYFPKLHADGEHCQMLYSDSYLMEGRIAFMTERDMRTNEVPDGSFSLVIDQSGLSGTAVVNGGKVVAHGCILPEVLQRNVSGILFRVADALAADPDAEIEIRNEATGQAIAWSQNRLSAKPEPDNNSFSI